MSELSSLEKTPPPDTECIGRKIIVLDKTDSTNNYASQLCKCGEADEGTVVIADEQTGGRGRFGHTWFAPAGKSVLMSTILNPGITVEHLPAVTAIGALAVVETAREEFDLDAMVCWPNDAVIKNKKFAGVLARVERFGRPGQRFILGIGLNVNVETHHFPAEFSSSSTSLKMELGAEVSREHVVRALLIHLDRWYTCLKQGRMNEIEHQLRKRLSLSGRTVTVEHRNQRYTGTVIDVSLIDGLLLQLPDGTTRSFPESLTTLLSK